MTSVPLEAIREACETTAKRRGITLPDNFVEDVHARIPPYTGLAFGSLFSSRYDAYRNEIIDEIVEAFKRLEKATRRAVAHD